MRRWWIIAAKEEAVENRYSEEEARSFCTRFAAVGEDVALRVYTSRLIGAEKQLVMHGGGNTSVKSTWRTLLGDELEGIFVKGSGWNLDSIEPPGLPGLDLAYLRRLRALEGMSDKEMVNELRTHLFDASSPNPSVETLLHAFLPHKFIDHSHADAILTLTNQPDGEELVKEALGRDIPVVPYVMPGFELAGVAAAVADEHPQAIGLVLHRHGLFTWGATAKDSYDRHIELVTRAEEWIAARTRGKRSVAVEAVPYDAAAARRAAASLAPLLRGALSQVDPDSRRWIVELRLSPAIWEMVHSPDVKELLLGPPLTPDHVTRTKERPLVVPAPEEGDVEGFRRSLSAALSAYVESYDRYFQANVERTGRELVCLDPLPRVVLVRERGIFCVGASLGEARIAGDLYEATVEVKSVAPLLGRYEGLSSEDLFDVEYWSLQQAKLGKAKERPLQRRVALVTGAGGAIGSAIVRLLCEDGACVVGCDIDAAALELVVERSGAGGVCTGVVADVTDESSIAHAFLEACARYGGVDVVVLNAGITAAAPIEELELETWRRVLEVNLTGYFTTLKHAVRLMKEQGTGGHVIVNASKNVFAPGVELAAYSASKAGGHQLGKLAAIELAPFGIRVNMINPDAIFADGDIPSGLWQELGPDRARSCGVSLDELEDYYRQRNLLKTRITAEDVARAVRFFAREETPTTGATLPVDGGIPTAFPR